ncbi:ribonuclease H2, subunit B [Boletus coccyginus]|nr:ribonuclease H2, subunit B [Boletus coccyginus]
MDTHFVVLPLDTVVSQFPDKTRLPRFLRLPHPRTGIGSLFLAHEAVPNEDEPDRKRVSKILEVQAVEPPNARSWFNGDEVISVTSSAEWVADGRLLVMTPVDPLFLLIPILGAINVGNFRPAEDIFEDAARHMAEASMTNATQDASMSFAALECTQKAMRRVCDVKEITAEITVFRYSSEKLVQELRKKVATLSTPRITEMSRCLVRSLAKDALMEDKNEDLLELGRTKLACELLGQYLPQGVYEELLATYDLVKLDAHVKSLANEQSLVAPVINKSKAGPTASEGAKKRKKGSQGVEKLKKANVSGMSKLSTFFTRKESSQ